MSEVVTKKPLLPDAPVALATPVAPLVPVATAEAARLDELMLAMDVVDTLRHKELVLARELDPRDAGQGWRRRCASPMRTYTRGHDDALRMGRR